MLDMERFRAMLTLCPSCGPKTSDCRRKIQEDKRPGNEAGLTLDLVVTPI
jgi:hypothetical protein